jgi:site-specific recombinase XerD
MDLAMHVDSDDDGWRIVGTGRDVETVNEFLDHLGHLNYSPHTVRAYAFDLVSFLRWLAQERLDLAEVSTEALLGYLAALRTEPAPRARSTNVRSIIDAGKVGYAPTTVNRRMAAISRLFGFLAMREPSAVNPMPSRRSVRARNEHPPSGLLGHLSRPQGRSPLRVREPRRLPRALEPSEAASLLKSLRTWRDQAIAGLMLFSGLRSGEVLGLEVRDVDIGARWIRVTGKGNRERRVPLDPDVGAVVQAYVSEERPECTTTSLFVVAKGPHRGRPLTPAGLRTVFRYHRMKSGVTDAHPHALRHSFGSALATAGVDLAVIQGLMGHQHADSAAAYIHLAPAHLRQEFDAARARQRARS